MSLAERLVGRHTIGYYTKPAEQGTIVAVFVDDHGELQLIVENPQGGLYQSHISGVTLVQENLNGE